MKKILALVLSLIMLLSLTSCERIRNILAERQKLLESIDTPDPQPTYEPTPQPTEGEPTPQPTFTYTEEDTMSPEAYALGCKARRIVLDYQSGALSNPNARDQLIEIYNQLETLYNDRDKDDKRYSVQTQLLDASVLMVLTDLNMRSKGEIWERTSGDIQTLVDQVDQFTPRSPVEGMSQEAYKLGARAFKLAQGYYDGLSSALETYQMIDDVRKQLDALYTSTEKYDNRFSLKCVELGTAVSVVAQDFQDLSNGKTCDKLDADIVALQALLAKTG